MDPNYRQRSQNEDEFMLFVLPTIEDSSHPSSSKNPIHTSKLSGAERVHEILTGHESLSKRNFRMEVSVFQALVNKLREKQPLVAAPLVCSPQPSLTPKSSSSMATTCERRDPAAACGLRRTAKLGLRRAARRQQLPLGPRPSGCRAVAWGAMPPTHAHMGKSNVLACRWGKRKYLDDGGTRGCMDPYGVVAASAGLGGWAWGSVDLVTDVGAGRFIGR